MRTLEELADRAELQDLMTAYATCVDSRDVDGLADVFLPDAQVSFAATGGPVGDASTVRAWLAETLPIFAATQHLLGNLALRLDGDTADGRCLCFNPMAFDPADVRDQRVMFYGLWYSLEFTRTPAGWRIARLTQEHAYHHNVPRR